MLWLSNFLVRLKSWLVDPHPTRLPLSVAAAPATPVTYQGDAICCALTTNRTVEVIYRVLQQYIPGYEKLPGDYGVVSLPDELTFPDEGALLRFCIADSALSGSFFWNKWHDNPHHLMVGAGLTDDGQLVMSLTMPATQTGQVEEKYLTELQLLIGSDCGVIYGSNYPPYKNGADFRLRYTNK